MSFNLQDASYIYQGHAFGVSAQFDHPNKDTLPTQAQAILAPTGGEAFSSVRNFNHRDAVVFDEAVARAVGSRDPDGSYHADVNASVRNLRFHQVHADLVTARVASVHRRTQTKAGVIEEGEITLAGSNIQGLTISGYKIDLTWDTEALSQFPTFERLRKGDPKRGVVYSRGLSKEDVVRTTIVKTINGCQPLSKAERTSILNDPKYMLPDVRCFDNVVLVPGFGKIFLGEVLIERGYRRITMLRLELGCGTGGGGSVGGGGGNGGDIPPSG